jgi:hypothetical protein
MIKKVASISLMLVLVVACNFSSLSVQKVNAASSPYEIPTDIQNQWGSVYGSKDADTSSGTNFVYDIYSKKYTQGGYSVVTKNFGYGNQSYINFQGWAVLFGYKDHTASNNSTYIVAKKVTGLTGVGTTKIYSTIPINISATKDLTFNGVPMCSAGTTNTDNSVCNMTYDSVGFNAYLPLNELFPDEKENSSWRLYLVKKVDSHIVYTDLKLPFSFNNKSFRTGELSLSSGVNANTLLMNSSKVLRKSYVGQPAQEVRNELGSDRYFPYYNMYTRVDSNENSTAIWYAVPSPKDGNAIKWAPTAYWDFGGSQARLTYSTNYIPPPSSACKPPVKPPARYAYQYDLEVTQIDGKTTDKNTNTTTTVEVHRKSYATARDQAKANIQKDIDSRKSQIQNLTNNLNQLKSQEASLENDLANANAANDFNKANQVILNLTNTRQSIADTQCSINTAQQEMDNYNSELNNLTTAETNNKSITTTVALKFNNTQQGTEQTVTLAEDERKTLTFTWKLPSDGTVSAEINPKHQTYSGLTENTYSNNVRETPIYVSSHVTPSKCANLNETSYAEGIVRTINSDSQGQQVLKEKLYSTLSIPVDQQKRRAGYGFEYTVTNQYINEDSTSNGAGPNKTMSYMPSVINYLPYQYEKWISPSNLLTISGYKVNLNKNSITGTPHNETTQWKLPVTYVEEYSGNVFADPNQSERNFNDKLLNGGNKWYLDFEQKDGPYQFSVVVPDVGVNSLNVCSKGEVDVEGSFIGDPKGNDDFVFRSVDPTNPFPSGKGWNWSGFESVISSIKDWWTNWLYPNPKEVPPNYHEEEYELPRSIIHSIREYNNSNGGSNQINLDDGFMSKYKLD